MATKYRGTRKEVRALNAYIRLLRSVESLTSPVHQPFAKYGLTVSQFGVLEALYHLGPLCQRDIGEKILKSGGNITVVVDNLEKRELVIRKRNTDDRRYITVHLSEHGEDLIREVFPLQLARITEDMNTLTNDEQDMLGKLCRKLGLGISR